MRVYNDAIRLPHRPLGCPRKHLEKNILVRLFVEPSEIDRRALKTLAALRIGFQRDHRHPARHLLHLDDVNQLAKAAGDHDFKQCTLGNAARPDEIAKQ
jgi:hypothetical protein